jgi:exodeoxyribonuclease X
MLKQASVEQMVAWTLEPKLLPKVPFGKHRGTVWADVPIDYLQWMIGQREMDRDATWCAKQELERRKLSQLK